MRYRISYNSRIIGYEFAASEAEALAKAVKSNPHHLAHQFVAVAWPEKTAKRITAAKLFSNPTSWMK